MSFDEPVIGTLIFCETNRSPAFEQPFPAEIETQCPGFFDDTRDVRLQNAAHHEPSACGQCSGVGIHIREQDVAVDIGQNEVVAPPGNPPYVAQHRFDAGRSFSSPFCGGQRR